MIRRLFCALLLSTLIALPACAQQTPATARDFAFESYSVHASKECGGSMSMRANRFNATNAMLFFLLYFAYATEISQDVVGLPAWGESACFTIDARMSDEDYAALQQLTSEERKKQQRHMMQLLLAEVFHLRLHAETRMQPVYEMRLARGGIKFKSWPADKPVEDGFWGFNSFAFHGTSLETLATNLTQILDRHVIDRTGLAGNYDIVLAPPREEAKDTEEVHAQMLHALEEQLGLKLEASKQPVTVYVIDHAEKPAAN